MTDLTKLNEAEDAVREIRRVGLELRRIERDGLPYNGPVIEWQSGNLAATRPEPHIALAPEYREENDIDVDADYLLALRLAVAMEAGYRERALDEQIEAI